MKIIKTMDEKMNYKDSSQIQDYLEFLNQSPTAWHAVDQAIQKLLKAGFSELKEEESWQIAPGNKYFVVRNGSSLCAFIVPHQTPISAQAICSHTDSPSFKLKPNAEFRKENMLMLGVEIYGGPLLSSWLNRDLGLAGRVVYTDPNGKMQTELIRLDDHPLVIPQLAIHLDRQVNEQGLLLNKQEHLAALAALDYPTSIPYLEIRVREKIKHCDRLLGTDLFLFPLESAALTGFRQQMLASYRIDNLGSMHASLTALLGSQNTSNDHLKMAVFWDNEEVGSETAQGAGSPFFSHVLERILLALDCGREEYLRLLRRSCSVSVDFAHALHPNYPEKHEPRHQPLLNKGIVLKANAQQRYATDAYSAAIIVKLCQQLNLSLQKFVSRGDIPCGTTIGPIHAGSTGISTVDIGCPQLSMHSCRELAGCQDHLDMCLLLKAFLEREA